MSISALLAETIETGALDRRVLRRIALEGVQPGQPGSWRFVFAAAGFAALVFVIVFGYRAIFHPAATGVYAAAARDHHLEIVERQPRRWVSDIASLEELRQRQGISASMISALARAGYRLEEGKLCRLDGKLFLHLVYSEGPSFFLSFCAKTTKRQSSENGFTFQTSAQNTLRHFRAGP